MLIGCSNVGQVSPATYHLTRPETMTKPEGRTACTLFPRYFLRPAMAALLLGLPLIQAEEALMRYGAARAFAVYLRPRSEWTTDEIEEYEYMERLVGHGPGGVTWRDKPYDEILFYSKRDVLLCKRLMAEKA